MVKLRNPDFLLFGTMIEEVFKFERGYQMSWEAGGVHCVGIIKFGEQLPQFIMKYPGIIN
jgi:hypothetical protein